MNSLYDLVATAQDAYAITATLTDDDGGEDTAQASVTVANVVPVLLSLESDVSAWVNA